MLFLQVSYGLAADWRGLKRLDWLLANLQTVGNLTQKYAILTFSEEIYLYSQ
jgi:hypothetical protein